MKEERMNNKIIQISQHLRHDGEIGLMGSEDSRLMMLNEMSEVTKRKLHEELE